MRVEPDLSVAREENLTRRQIDRRILALAIPALAALAADPLLSLVDTGFVSRLGAVPLAALGVTSAIFGFAFVLFNFLAYATTPMVARAFGKNDLPGAADLIARALWLAIILGLISMAVLIGFAHPLVRLIHADPEVVGPAVSYLRVRALAAPAVLTALALHGGFRGMQDTRTPLRVTVIVNVINALLCPLLIFAAGWGVVGAAAASVIAQYLGAVWLFRLVDARVGGLPRTGHTWTSLRPLLSAGGVITTRTLMLVVTISASTAIAARLGTSVVAAHQVVRETWFLTAMLVDGLAIAAQALVAEQHGQSDPTIGRATIFRLFYWGGLVGLVMTGLWMVAGPALAAVFAPDPTVNRLIREATTVIAAFAFPAALLWVFDGIVLGWLRLRLMVVSTAAGLVAGFTVFGLTLRQSWGIRGVWLGIGAMVMARLVVLAWSSRKQISANPGFKPSIWNG